MDSLWTSVAPRNITSVDGSCYKVTDSSISQNGCFFPFFHLKMFSIQCRKNHTVKDSKKRLNINNFINIYIQIDVPILYVTRITQNNNFSINWILLHGRGSISYFRISIFDSVSQIVQTEGSYNLLSYKD